MASGKFNPRVLSAQIEQGTMLKGEAPDLEHCGRVDRPVNLEAGNAACNNQRPHHTGKNFAKWGMVAQQDDIECQEGSDITNVDYARTLLLLQLPPVMKPPTCTGHARADWLTLPGDVGGQREALDGQGAGPIIGRVDLGPQAAHRQVARHGHFKLHDNQAVTAQLQMVRTSPP
jgi:hypothetical protein